MSIECTFCGEDNKDSASCCQNCGKNFTSDKGNISINDLDKRNLRPLLKMYEVRMKKEIVIAQDGVIGHYGDIEQSFFRTSPYVSKHHCKIYYEGGHWRVEHISHTNPTSINGISLCHNIPMIIREGDHLRIADLFFKITIDINESSCKSPPKECDSTNDHEEGNCENIWEIKCPICGTKYIGKDESFHMEKCTGPCRFDEFDEREIANVLPRKIRRSNAD